MYQDFTGFIGNRGLGVNLARSFGLQELIFREVNKTSFDHSIIS